MLRFVFNANWCYYMATIMVYWYCMHNHLDEGQGKYTVQKEVVVM